MDLEVYSIGHEVLIGDGVDGVITGITIRGGGRVTYEIVYWAGGRRQCEWFEPCEVTSHEEPRFSIGFRTNLK